MADTLTVMAVPAPPDGEASSTGGVLAKYGDEDIRTVVVTCTNGEFGDSPGGVKPGQDGHDEQAVAQIRLAELRESCKHLGVTDLELLGYHDSGMPDWEYKNRPDAFCNVPQSEVAGRIGALIEHYRPQVVISYDPEGAYQHPDHVHAARCAAARASCGRATRRARRSPRTTCSPASASRVVSPGQDPSCRRGAVGNTAHVSGAGRYRDGLVPVTPPGGPATTGPWSAAGQGRGFPAGEDGQNGAHCLSHPLERLGRSHA